VHFKGEMNLSKYNTKSNRLHMTLVSILVQEAKSDNPFYGSLD
jgi:hypothetical protein